MFNCFILNDNIYNEDFKGDPGRYRNDRGGFKGGKPGKRGKPGGRPRELLKDKLEGRDNAQILFVGSVNCLRHKPYLEIGQLMREGKASILCPTMSDFSSGRYLAQIEKAIEELSEERDCKDFVIICGCQWVILSTDGDLICEHLKTKGINAVISQDDHLEFGDHD
ncbi:MAG: hypothetical protein ACOX75_05950 [Lachnospiraceae bacterium]|jgi:hypothetical protein